MVLYYFVIVTYKIFMYKVGVNVCTKMLVIKLC